jgi:hypothetical protein
MAAAHFWLSAGECREFRDVPVGMGDPQARLKVSYHSANGGMVKESTLYCNDALIPVALRADKVG